MADTNKLKEQLSALTASFDELESLLEPLLAQPLPETLVGLETIQQAKLQTAIPYVVYDLIFVYLKSKGINPKSHPVISELDRIRQYFEKINNAENPPAKPTQVDKEAATRFIKHAIAQSQWKKTPAEEAQEIAKTAPSSSTRVPVKITHKMLDREAYEKELKTRKPEEDDEEELEVFNDENDAVAMDVDEPSNASLNAKGKGKGKEPSNITSKRRRPAVDPFAASGYGDDIDSTNKKSKPSSKKATPDPSPPISGTTTPIPTSASLSSDLTSEISNSKPSNKKEKKKRAKKTSS